MHAGITLPIIQATVNIDPDVLNSKSKGEWITGYVELPEGYSVLDIDVPAIELYEEETIIAQAEWADIQQDILMVKFGRPSLISYLNGRTGEVTLTLAGVVSDVDFEGGDTITVIQ